MNDKGTTIKVAIPIISQIEAARTLALFAETILQAAEQQAGNNTPSIKECVTRSGRVSRAPAKIRTWDR